MDASVFSEFWVESECEYVLLLSCDNKFIQVSEGLHILADAGIVGALMKTAGTSPTPSKFSEH